MNSTYLVQHVKRRKLTFYNTCNFNVIFTEGQICMARFYVLYAFVVFEVICDTCDEGILILRQRYLSKQMFAQIYLSQY